MVAFGSIRSCAVTTLATGLAATWPAGGRVLVIEADPAGGTLAATSGWPPEPGLVSLAAAARRGGEPSLVWEHCHELPGGAAVLAGPALGEQARSAWAMAGPLLARLGELDAAVLVDCGRLDPGSPAVALWERADRAVVVARPRLADLHALASWRQGRTLDRRVALVLVGDGPYPDAEVAQALGLEVLARLPWDPDAAEVLTMLPASDRRLRLAPLVRAVRTLADRLAAEAVAERGTNEPVPATGPSGRAVSVRSRLLRAWRADTEPRADAQPSSNGSVPEEASR